MGIPSLIKSLSLSLSLSSKPTTLLRKRSWGSSCLCICSVCVRARCVCVCVCVCVRACVRVCVRDGSACIDLLRLTDPRISKRGDGIGHGVTGRHVSVIICIFLAVFPFHSHLHAVVCTMPGDKNACGKIECARNSAFTHGSEACVSACLFMHACVRAYWRCTH
jgi:hypothetical protein